MNRRQQDLQSPFNRMPDDLNVREFDILLELVGAVQDWLCDKYDHLLGPDPEPSPCGDRPLFR